jgi:hypothetical protein
MDCCVFNDLDQDGPAVYVEKTRRAAKEHQCTECGEVIPKAATYEHTTGMWDGDWSTYKTCSSCVEIRNHFAKACGGQWIFGQIWTDIEENFFPDMRAGGPCMEGLSPEAKGRLFERRLKWLEDTNE